MRLWTLHPRYLDAAGLVAAWREALLAQKALRGLTRGYTRHPQLIRFRAVDDPVAAIASHLAGIHEEAMARGYSFQGRKIAEARFAGVIEETRGQLLYEWVHLLTKLKRRSPGKYTELRSIKNPVPHPLFRIVPGGVRSWEKR